jgi:hypothetical protein
MTFRVAVALAIALASASQAAAQSPAPTKFEGTINDYVVALGSTWQVSGVWSLELKGESGLGSFSASLSMGLPGNPASPAHTHHVTLVDADVTYDDTDADPDNAELQLTGDAELTGNGNASFAGSSLVVQLKGGNALRFSNMSLTFVGDAATNHFGAAPLVGVVAKAR